VRFFTKVVVMITALAALALVAGIGRWIASSAHHVRATDALGAPRQGVNHSETDALRRQLANLGQQVQELRATGTGANHLGDTDAAPPSEPTPEPTLADELEQLRADARTLDERVASESVDAEWSSAAASRVRDFFLRTDMRGSRVLGVDCRTSLCRVAVEHQSARDRSRFLEVYVDGPTDLRIEIYLSRSGPVLPSAIAAAAKP
jgi:hypothetical protein